MWGKITQTVSATVNATIDATMGNLAPRPSSDFQPREGSVLYRLWEEGETERKPNTALNASAEETATKVDEAAGKQTTEKVEGQQ